MPKNWCLRVVVLEKTHAIPLGSKEIKPVNLKGDWLWIFTGKTDAEAEVPVFWSSDVNSWLSGKVPDAGKDRGQKEKRATEEEVVGQHHRCDEYELGQTRNMVRDRETWHAAVHRVVESDMTGWLNNKNNNPRRVKNTGIRTQRLPSAFSPADFLNSKCTEIFKPDQRSIHRLILHENLQITTYCITKR